MQLTIDTVLSPLYLTIEVDGVEQNNVIELDTQTGKARRYKKDEDGKFERIGDELVLEDVIFPPESLHVYLVKPK